MKRKVRTFDPILREVSDAVTDGELNELGTKEGSFYTLLQDMKEMVVEFGLGIAAVQFGELKRLVVIQPFKEKEPIVFINPVVLKTSKVTSYCYEGCMSLPGVYEFVERPEECIVQYTDEEGREQTGTLVGIEAATFLHEYDHLDGTLFVDRVFNRFQRRAFERKYRFTVEKVEGYV